jgi:hypothetical protein
MGEMMRKTVNLGVGLQTGLYIGKIVISFRHSDGSKTTTTGESDIIHDLYCSSTSCSRDSKL